MKNIAIIGLPGSGKTSLGKALAERLNRPFIDLDGRIEENTGKTIPEIFAAHGEVFFRQIEADAVREAVKRDGAVISTGGGAILLEGNTRILRENGLVIFLDRPVEAIARDVETGHRPLLKGGAESLYKLDGERRGLYKAAAHVTVANGGAEGNALDALTAVAETAFLRGYAVIGDPIGHSISPAIHKAAFSVLGTSEDYAAVHVPRGRAGEFLAAARYGGLAGFNATIPHKQDLLPFLDEVQDEALLANSVNTVTLKGGKAAGYNTDMDGLAAALADMGSGYKNRRVLLIGTGGAANGVALKAAREGCEALTLLGRRPEKAEEIRGRVKAAAGLDAKTGDMTLSSLEEAAGRAELLVNATPLGMSGINEDFEDFAFLRRLPQGAAVCDLIYNPPKTNLLAEAENLGLTTMNGLGMLIYQALLAEEHFFGKKLDKAALYTAVLAAINRGTA